MSKRQVEFIAVDPATNTSLGEGALIFQVGKKQVHLTDDDSLFDAFVFGFINKKLPNIKVSFSADGFKSSFEEFFPAKRFRKTTINKLFRDIRQICIDLLNS